MGLLYACHSGDATRVGEMNKGGKTMRKVLGMMVVLALVVILAVPAFAGPRGAQRPGPAGGRGPGAGPQGVAQTIPAEVHAAIQTATQAAAAQVLGMTPEALRQALTTSRMAAIAAQKNVPLSTVQAAMRQARTQTINDLVKTGKLTAAQAAVLLQAGRGAGVGPQQGPGQGGGRGRGPRW
jgi:hypothetical protein